MDFSSCPLYGIQSKKVLKHLLKIPDKKFFNQDFVANLISPYIEIKAGGKKRLIEPPSDSLKKVQHKIKKAFYSLKIPPYVFSGVKSRSYIDNAKLHIGKRFLYKLDFTAFFPSIERETVYNFFINKLYTSPDIASILTSYTTVDIDKASCNDIDSINDFLTEKCVNSRNHLISGAPTSQILSYLANTNMFDELYSYSLKKNLIMSIYVDDIFFSCHEKIDYKTRKKLKSIISYYGYTLSLNKEKTHTRYYPKNVTGVIINKNGHFSIKKSLTKNIIHELNYLKRNPKNEKSKLRLRGLVVAARQVVPSSYPGIYHLVFR